MPTKLSRFCDGILEAGWLISIIVVPLFFNVYSSRIFEPDKLTLLRSIALLMGVAWIVKLIAEGGLRWNTLSYEGPLHKFILKIPLAWPVLALVVVYLLSTLFSLIPRVSLMGSYQRLQGAYTTFSYLLVFAAIAANMRKRAQVERFINAIVLTSLPVSLYGILQRYKIDPVPWAGDVTSRVASNMGNAIFVAAYLIMANPFTLLRIVQSFEAILKEKEGLIGHLVRSTVYVFIAALQVIALYLSGSRGPWLGWFAGLFFLFILLTLYARRRTLMLVIMGVSLVFGAFLLVLNIPNGPLQPLRSLPYLGRIGHLLESDSATGRVRVLIWQGAAELVTPHAPLEYPDGSQDNLNFLRPLIGYGPEMMYVAFNRYYPPELGQLEKRNASPDRSHNETWDSLVITGILGLGVYLSLIASIFYYGLKWLGLITSTAQRNRFLIFYLGSGLAGAIGFVLWQGWGFMGVGLPFGIIIGLIGYLTVEALLGLAHDPTSSVNPMAIYVIPVLAAIAAHFVETNFGIAIAVTRTYFWAFTGLMFVAGYIYPKVMAEETGKESPLVVETASDAATRKKQRRIERPRRPERDTGSPLAGVPAWVQAGLVGALLGLVIFLTLGYDFLSNSSRSTSITTIIVNSMTVLANRDGVTSFGVLALILTTWLSAAIILTPSQRSANGGASGGANGGANGGADWLKSLGLTLGVTFLVGLIFWAFQASNLVGVARANPTNLEQLLAHLERIGGMLTGFYFLLGVIGVALAFLLPDAWPVSSRSASAMPALVGAGLLPLGLVLVYFTNLVAIHANMSFKMGEPLSGEQWPVATAIFDHTIQLQPQEDFYYLYLGRSYLEQAKLSDDAQKQGELILQAEAILNEARTINSLNTDHTANLARLYSWWSSRATDAELRLDRGEQSDRYYSQALLLSPNNATLWAEWATVLMSINRMDEAYQKLTHSLELDPTYGLTHVLMGDYYMRLAQSLSASETYTDTMRKAAAEYGLAGDAKGDAKSRANYYSSQANVYIQLGDHPNVVAALQKALTLKPSTDLKWRIVESLARAYIALGDKDAALEQVEALKQIIPAEQVARVDSLTQQIAAMSGGSAP